MVMLSALAFYLGLKELGSAIADSCSNMASSPLTPLSRDGHEDLYTERPILQDSLERYDFVTLMECQQYKCLPVPPAAPNIKNVEGCRIAACAAWFPI